MSGVIYVGFLLLLLFLFGIQELALCTCYFIREGDCKFVSAEVKIRSYDTFRRLFQVRNTATENSKTPSLF